MLKDFVSNTALLISAFFVLGQLFKNRPLKASSPLSTKLYWGLSYGILGNILMIFSIKISTTTIADLRHLAIVLAAAFGGFIPALLASALIVIGRFLLFSYSDAALYASIGMLFIAIISSGLARLNYNFTMKAFFMNLIGLFILTIVFTINIEDPIVLKKLLIMHYIFSLTGGFIAYHFSVFIAHSNENQRKLKNSLIELKETQHKLEKSNERLNQLSYVDGLTGVGNRRYFDTKLAKAWLHAQSDQVPISLLMFDIDFFKKYNDTYGHLTGDYCLQTISQAINNLVTEDSSYTLCRYGGEEFSLIMPAANRENAEQFAALITKTVKELNIPHINSEIAEIVTLSIGIASFIPGPTAKPKDLIQLADEALYTSKTKGRDTISIL
ncbi:diguanylate cyclase domain-containing protein [Neobacillus sp. SAB-20_R2A]|uniref:diguanylate cyclase domain-containing protein n=1 Tax=Neobacillus sp. SAB-20_R2A TaxID=3120519 RepID=UPI003C6E64BF